jgi:hypothetical protein
MRDNDHRPVGQLTARQLDLYGNQLTRCLKALGAEAPIHADVQGVNSQTERSGSGAGPAGARPG